MQFEKMLLEFNLGCGYREVRNPLSYWVISNTLIVHLGMYEITGPQNCVLCKCIELDYCSSTYVQIKIKVYSSECFSDWYSAIADNR